MAARWFYYLFLASIFLKIAEMYAAHACGPGVYGRQCKKRCSDRHCADVSTPCPAWDGYCSGKCQDGWRGRDCTRACSEDGLYGAGCRFYCSSRHCASSRVSCDKVTGDCGAEGCEPGWKGIDCTQTCEWGVEYGPNCNKSCSDRHCITTSNYCDKEKGQCFHGCQPGWTGIDCLQEENTIPVSRCPPGWKGTGCKKECAYGVTYGPNCEKSCKNRHCLNGSSCSKETGECKNDICKAGWTGIDCTEVCSQDSYGPECSLKCSERHCMGDSSCNHITGACENGCQSGWAGTDCRVCKRGVNYGSNCEKKCSSRHCISTNMNHCDPINGSCHGHCEAGWMGIDCTEECSEGITYGANCHMNCSDRHCVKTSNCDKKSGKCIGGCQPGWRGSDCLQKCDRHHYGSNCSLACSKRHCKSYHSYTCNSTNGACPKGCDFGWQGVDCTECSEGITYGANCHKNCSDHHCVKHSKCDKKSGKCIGGCQPGWRGSDCSQKCDKYHYGSNCSLACSKRHCKSYRSYTCNSTNGACPKGCDYGWEGVDCTECSEGITYGVNCRMNCSDRHCLKNSNCHKKSGKCIGGCQPGWRGSDCLQKCDHKHYGANCSQPCSKRHCEGYTADTCNHVNGSCPGGCKTGWKGTDCTECNNTYGTNCGLTCSVRHCKKDNSSCDSKTGECVGGCKPGWKNLSCTEKCPSGSYGYECRNSCADRNCNGNTSHCDKETGECVEGCKAGWSGMSCISKAASSTSGWFPVTISSIIVVIILCVIIALIIFKRRKSQLESVKSDYTNVSSRTLVIPDKLQNENDKDHENVYCNTSENNPAVTGILSSDLPLVVEQINNQAGGFEAEFKKLPNEFWFPTEYALIPENRCKNRFVGYYPYDQNRVVLSSLIDVPYSDYINASYIDGYSVSNQYIAAQAPNTVTLQDFWRMLWEQECGQIIMLTNLVEATKHKCEPYWSDNEMMTFGLFTVSVTEREERCNFVIRKFRVTKTQNGETKIFQQFHFTSWPDHGVPNINDFIEFIWRVRSTTPVLSGPRLVHCSAGIGRTGTYIAVDILLDQMEKTNRINNVSDVLTKMRQQRKGMVQTKEQYECIFLTLIELCNHGNTAVTNADYQHLYTLNKGAMIMGKKTVDNLAQEIVYLNKTEFAESPEKYRVFVTGHDDMFAVLPPSKLSKHGYLLILDNKETGKGFWKMVIENGSHTTISFNSQSEAKLIPGMSLSVNQGDSRITTLRQTQICDEIKETVLKVETVKETESKQIYYYGIHGWSHTADFTTMVSILTTLTEKIQDQQMYFGLHPVSVFYRDFEAKNAFTLCIANNVMTGIKLDKEVEIFNNIRRFQNVIPNVKIAKDDFTIFCNLALVSLEASTVYANCP